MVLFFKAEYTIDGKLRDVFLKQFYLDVKAKFPPRSIKHEIDTLNKFKEEIKNLKNSRIIDYFGHYLDEKSPVISLVFEYAENGSLNLFRKSNYPFTDVPSIGLQIAEGIQLLHSKTYAHRDIKPANIVMTKDGSIKLTDFGQCRLFTQSTDTEVGTLQYLPPEILAKVTDPNFKDKPYIRIPKAPTIDIFSFGVTLWQLYHPRQEIRPFAGVRFPDFTNPECDDRMRNLIEKCCVTNPNDRYTAREVVLELNKYISDKLSGN